MAESLSLHEQCDNIDKQIRAEIKAEVDNNNGNSSHRCACLIRARANLQECISNLLEAGV